MINYGFFNAELNDGEYDRKYNAEDLTNYLKPIIGNGVFVEPANSLQVFSNSDLTVSIRPGVAWINGYYFRTDDTIVKEISPAHATLDRIDRVVIELDLLDRQVFTYIKRGAAASNPTAPALTRTDNYYEISLADIRVRAGTTSILTTDITDTRLDSTVCGKVAVLIDHIDTSDIYNQFWSWFEDIKDTLQNNMLFIEFKNTTVTTDTISELPIAINNYIANYDILSVYVNGWKLVENTDYTADTNKIYFTNPINVAGTVIEQVVYKNVDSREEVTTIVSQVVANTNDISAIKTRNTILDRYIYNCNGSTDNEELSDICQDFLLGTGDFAGVNEYAHMEIEVIGTFGVTNNYSGNGTTQYPYTYLALGNIGTNTSNRTLKINFNKCSRFLITAAAAPTDVIVGSDINIEGLEMVVSGGTATNLFSGSRVNAKNCKFNVTGSGEVIGGNCCGTFENVRMSITSTGGNAFGYVGTGTGILRVVGGTIYAYTGNGSSESAGLYVQANKTENVLIADSVNIPLNTRAGYTQTNTIKINSGLYSLINCVLGKAAAKYSTGAGMTETGTMIISKVL